MWASTRKKFTYTTPSWPQYVEFLGVSALTEVRSLDRSLNDYVNGCGDYPCSLASIEEALEVLPPAGNGEYHLLILDASLEERPGSESWGLLGHDLSDETHTSSLLNCGSWRGKLEPIAKRMNEFGLLSFEDALSAQKILPIEWGEGEPHAHVTIWALYERIRT